MKKIYKNSMLIGIAILFVLLITQIFFYRQQNDRMLGLITDYEASRFLSGLGYLGDLETRIDNWTINRRITKDEVELELTGIRNSIKAFQEVVEDYNRVYSDELPLPNTLLNSLRMVESQFLEFKNRSITASPIDLSLNEIDALQNYDRKLKEIMVISKTILNYESGLSGDEWEKLSEQGLFAKGLLVQWFQQVESSLLPYIQ